ncbi:MAG: hypothetical protein WBS24_00480 [Terriglobales bacterium]
MAMHFRSQVIVVLLMAALAAAMWPLQARMATGRQENSSGCHEHSGKTPAHNHDCCLTGHDVAAPQNSHFSRPDNCGSAALNGQPVLTAVVIAAEKPLSIYTADPPGSSPLRI